MTGRDTRRFDMLTRVRNFGVAYAQRFPTTSPAPEAFAAVAAEIERLQTLDVAERAASEMARSDRQRAARTVFARTLRRLGSTARVLAKTTPQLEARVPVSLPQDDLGLLTIGRQFAASVAGYELQFAAHGLPLPVLEQAIAAFQRAVEDRKNGHDDQVKARAEIEAAFARALHAVDTIGVTVQNYLADDPVALTLWKHERHVRPPRRAAASEAPAADHQPSTEAVPSTDAPPAAA